MAQHTGESITHIDTTTSSSSRSRGSRPPRTVSYTHQHTTHPCALLPAAAVASAQGNHGATAADSCKSSTLCPCTPPTHPLLLCPPGHTLNTPCTPSTHIPQTQHTASQRTARCCALPACFSSAHRITKQCPSPGPQPPSHPSRLTDCRLATYSACLSACPHHTNLTRCWVQAAHTVLYNSSASITPQQCIA
jgi:hypothetical protein